MLSARNELSFRNEQETLTTPSWVLDVDTSETKNHIIPDKDKPIILDRLSHPDYHLNRPIQIKREDRDNRVFLFNDELNAYSTGINLLDALKELQNILYAHYDTIALCDDSKLTKRASTLKQNLLQYISKSK
jgi:hypothetical protein